MHVLQPILNMISWKQVFLNSVGLLNHPVTYSLGGVLRMTVMMWNGVTQYFVLELTASWKKYNIGNCLIQNQANPFCSVLSALTWRSCCFRYDSPLFSTSRCLGITLRTVILTLGWLQIFKGHGKIEGSEAIPRFTSLPSPLPHLT